MPYALYLMPYALCLMPYAVCRDPQVLGSAGRQAEGQALAEALASGHVHQVKETCECM
jgi:hypothetical protein